MKWRLRLLQSCIPSFTCTMQTEKERERKSEKWKTKITAETNLRRFTKLWDLLDSCLHILLHTCCCYCACQEMPSEIVEVSPQKFTTSIMFRAMIQCHITKINSTHSQLLQKLKTSARIFVLLLSLVIPFLFRLPILWKTFHRTDAKIPLHLHALN